MGANGRARFRPDQRLLSAQDYRRVFSAPDHKAGQQEILLLARHNGQTAHRLGLAIAKKHIPTAVKRNELKRLARETFRKLQFREPGLDIVVLSRPGAATAPKGHLHESLGKQFQRLIARSQPS